MNYEKYFKDRVIIISGVGRSGTTILGKIVGSMKNCMYFFEPAIMKYFPATKELENATNTIWNFDIKQAFLATLFEDYILPSVQGRNINMNMQDWSYWENYQTYSDLRKKWNLSRRSSALKWLENNDVRFVFKVNESQYLYDTYNNLFEGMKLLYVYRNGIDTVNSMMERGWFKDDYEPIDLYEKSNSVNVPIWVEDTKVYDYTTWNQETRCAYAWRYLNQLGFKYLQDNKIETIVNYDLLIKNSQIKDINYNYLIKGLNKYFDISETELTVKHLYSISDFVKNNKNKYPNFDILDKIQEPELSKFLGYNKDLKQVMI